MSHRIANVYNEAAIKSGKSGRMHGIEGDIRRNASIFHLIVCVIGG